jgi:hypothetical protein
VVPLLDVAKDWSGRGLGNRVGAVPSITHDPAGNAPLRGLPVSGQEVDGGLAGSYGLMG